MLIVKKWTKKNEREQTRKKQNTVKEKQKLLTRSTAFSDFWTCTKFWLCFLFCFCFGDMYSHWKHSRIIHSHHTGLSLSALISKTHTHTHTQNRPYHEKTTSTNGTTRWLSKLFAWPPLLFKLPSLATNFPVDGELRLNYSINFNPW